MQLKTYPSEDVLLDNLLGGDESGDSTDNVLIFLSLQIGQRVKPNRHVSLTENPQCLFDCVVLE